MRYPFDKEAAPTDAGSWPESKNPRPDNLSYMRRKYKHLICFAAALILSVIVQPVRTRAHVTGSRSYDLATCDPLWTTYPTFP
jgi:hypothetical protein